MKFENYQNFQVHNFKISNSLLIKNKIIIKDNNIKEIDNLIKYCLKNKTI